MWKLSDSFWKERKEGRKENLIPRLTRQNLPRTFPNFRSASINLKVFIFSLFQRKTHKTLWVYERWKTRFEITLMLSLFNMVILCEKQKYDLKLLKSICQNESWKAHAMFQILNICLCLQRNSTYIEIMNFSFFCVF